ncbi:TerB N-terminal domain-containing protein [uncultured Ruminococcus sp.]|uniref:TerB N-terminal domain-containing protein n=1 Tax=uncultured Ruminococcus sp. TaxID=165186 RepID=UPI0025CEDAB3|nr:TerB N-terminal domain-containing protein [uncultured Ruminococcus sp.]
MKDLDELIEQIISDVKQKNNTSGEKIYRDEPIICRASQLIREKAVPKTETPEKLMEMRRMAYTSEAQWKSREWLFYKQGKFMEDYEDVYPFTAEFEKYYPVYSDMTLEQQRTYFNWRTKVRRGEYNDISLSYIFVYSYELINLIGAESPDDAYNKLKALLDNYCERYPKLKIYLNIWLFDMVIYYGMDTSLLGNNEIKEYDSAVMVLKDVKVHSCDKIFSALNMLSSYNCERSSFYKTYPEDMKKVSAAVYISLTDLYSDKKNSMFDKYVGKSIVSVHQMFSAAVFCHYRTVKHTKVVVDAVRSYIFQKGEWYCEEYVGKTRGNKKIGELLRAVDSIMRQRYGYKTNIQCPDVIKRVIKEINEQIDILLEEKKREEAARIDIDLSKLGGIRRAAEITRDKLIVEEEEEELPDIAQTETPADTGNDTPLNDGEYKFMQALLYGGDVGAAAKEAGTMPSILADSINEKLYDTFADTVIEFDGDAPVIIEDYEEELKGMILP